MVLSIEVLYFRKLILNSNSNVICAHCYPIEWAKKVSFVDARAWKRTLFTEEKRFCLDGLDSLAYLWSDKRLERGEFSKRQCGGDCTMVWVGISWKGKTSLMFGENTIDAAGYTAMLGDA